MLSPLDLMPDSFMTEEECYFENEADAGQFATGLHTVSV
jgi:hypothetical protein